MNNQLKAEVSEILREQGVSQAVIERVCEVASSPHSTANADHLETLRRAASPRPAADDVGAALATVIMAIVVSLENTREYSFTTADMLGAIQEELAHSKLALREPGGSYQPAGEAVNYAEAMLRLSDPASIAAPAPPTARELSTAAEIAAVAEEVWPGDTIARLAQDAGVSPRAAQYWGDMGAGMSADALANLLRSDSGLAYLEGVLGQAKPAWWTKFQATLSINDRLDALRNDIREARDGLIAPKSIKPES